MDDAANNLQVATEWSPEIIADLISNIVSTALWPLVVLIIVWRFKDTISSGLANLLNDNDSTKVTVEALGMTARLEATKQSTSSINSHKPSPPLPDGQNIETIKRLQMDRSSTYSLHLKEQLETQIAGLDTDDTQKIEILCTELSLTQAALNYVDVTSLLFKTQYKVMDAHYEPSLQPLIPRDLIEEYFNEKVKPNYDTYIGWDTDRYLAYPLAINLLEPVEGGYKLTVFGASYIKWVRNNPIHLDYLANL